MLPPMFCVAFLSLLEQVTLVVPEQELFSPVLLTIKPLVTGLFPGAGGKWLGTH